MLYAHKTFSIQSGVCQSKEFIFYSSANTNISCVVCWNTLYSIDEMMRVFAKILKQPFLPLHFYTPTSSSFNLCKSKAILISIKLIYKYKYLSYLKLFMVVVFVFLLTYVTLFFCSRCCFCFYCYVCV